ncbi:MAG: cyclic 2,3-diphosphoglycerate synthetase [Thermoleophilaceae bacterium]|nr:cyclic 2,3-diphosphoglycerate synthetase [Thermoleophilaceae bacterium]
MTIGQVIALIDGEHHPDAVRAALDRLDSERGVVGVVFCGGEEKLRGGILDQAAEHYGRAVEIDVDPVAALRRVASRGAGAVVDLADEPVLPPRRRMLLASAALDTGLAYEGPDARLAPPRYEPVAFDGPKLAVIGTGKRTGKTAVAGHWGALLRGQGLDPVIVCMGRGGPAKPRLVEPDIALDDLLALAESGEHAASDYLEGAVLGGCATVGCRRVGGGLAGAPFADNVAAGAAVAAERGGDALIFEGSGASIPPVTADRTVCLVGDGAFEGLGAYRMMRAHLCLVTGGAEQPRLDAEEAAAICPGRTLRCELRPEAVEPVPAGARVALFSTGPAIPDGIEPVVNSRNLSARGALATDLDQAAAERCDHYLTELKAAAIDTVAVRARAEGATVGFIRNRPLALDGDLDEALLTLHRDAAGAREHV